MLKVKDIMSTIVITLRPEDTLKTARSIMQQARIRHVPIVDQNHTFRGLITHRDILSATVSQLAGIDRQTQEEIDAGIPLKEVMRKDTFSVSQDADVIQAAEILLKNKYGCLPVVKQETLVGIITGADLIMLAIRLLKLQAKTTRPAGTETGNSADVQLQQKQAGHTQKDKKAHAVGEGGQKNT